MNAPHPTGAVITGVGLITAGGDAAITTFEDLSHGDPPPVCRISSWPPGTAPFTAAVVRRDDVNEALPPQRLRTLPDEAALAQAAVRRAVAEAGLDLAAANVRRIGVSVATQHAGIEDYAAAWRGTLDATVGVSPTRGPQSGFNAPAGQLSIRLGLLGPNATLINGAVGGVDALLYSIDALENGTADAMVVCGVDVISAALTPALGAMATPGRPRSPGRDLPELTYGSGAAALLVEREASARKRGAQPIAHVMSAATAYSAAHRPIEATGRVLRDALALAKITAEDLVVCFTGANGSVPGDDDEHRALSEHLGPTTSFVAVKRQTGELFGASAVLQLGVAAMSLHRRALPGSGRPAGSERLTVTRGPTPLPPGLVLVHAWDAGGAAGAAILGPAHAR